MELNNALDKKFFFENIVWIKAIRGKLNFKEVNDEFGMSCMPIPRCINYTTYMTMSSVLS